MLWKRANWWGKQRSVGLVLLLSGAQLWCWGRCPLFYAASHILVRHVSVILSFWPLCAGRQRWRVPHCIREPQNGYTIQELYIYIYMYTECMEWQLASILLKLTIILLVLMLTKLLISLIFYVTSVKRFWRKGLCQVNGTAWWCDRPWENSNSQPYSLWTVIWLGTSRFHSPLVSH